MSSADLSVDTIKLMTTQWHGTRGRADWALPTKVVDFDVAARDYSDVLVKAHEYADDPAVLRAKVRALAGMVRAAGARVVAFTGAGISTAAGIDDYATKAKRASVTAAGRPLVRDWRLARPTLAHRALAAMHRAGRLAMWVQQNHDSLPQKAGYPQRCLNEIHGSLHDPANPIVPYEGTLRDDLFAWLEEWRAKCGLCLALGTSLSGFSVDAFAEAAAARGARGDGEGLVLVNLQVKETTLSLRGKFPL